MADFLEETPASQNKRCERAFLIGVQTPQMQPGEGEELLSELKELVENLHIGVVERVVVNLRAPTPATLLGSSRLAGAGGLNNKPKRFC